MREIKFRFWSKLLKRMVIPDDKMFVGALKDPNIVVMQDTGLKDIDGEEIYEGDKVWVIPQEVNMKFTGQIIYKNGGFQFESGSKKIKPTFFLEYCDKIKVIGNIYEG